MKRARKVLVDGVDPRTKDRGRLTARDVVAMTVFMRTATRTRLTDLFGDLVVEWPAGCADVPETHEAAATQALELMRGDRDAAPGVWS